MGRSNYNYDMDKGTRRDLRNQADPYVRAGVRNIHRDIRGNVIGGITAEGQRITGGGFRVPPMTAETSGIASTATQPAKSRLGMAPMQSQLGRPSTPGLDAGPQTPGIDSNRPGSPGETFAQTEARKRQESSLSGAFGKTAQTLAKNRRKPPVMAPGTFDPATRLADTLKLPQEKSGWRKPMALASL